MSSKGAVGLRTALRVTSYYNVLQCILFCSDKKSSFSPIGRRFAISVAIYDYLVVVGKEHNRLGMIPVKMML